MERVERKSARLALEEKSLVHEGQTREAVQTQLVPPDAPTPRLLPDEEDEQRKVLQPKALLTQLTW